MKRPILKSINNRPEFAKVLARVVYLDHCSSHMAMDDMTNFFVSWSYSCTSAPWTFSSEIGDSASSMSVRRESFRTARWVMI